MSSTYSIVIIISIANLSTSYVTSPNDEAWKYTSRNPWSNSVEGSDSYNPQLPCPRRLADAWDRVSSGVCISIAWFVLGSQSCSTLKSLPDTTLKISSCLSVEAKEEKITKSDSSLEQFAVSSKQLFLPSLPTETSPARLSSSLVPRGASVTKPPCCVLVSELVLLSLPSET